MACTWFRDHIRQVHMDFHMPEFPPSAIRNFNAKEFVDHLEHGKVNLVALFAKCHFGNSFYNTRAGHKHRGLEADFLMETASECRRRGIRTLAYYSLCWDKRAWDGNPAWRYVDAEGNTVGDERPWGVLCMNTPYKDDLVMPQLDEIAADYPVDGFWLDIPLAAGPGGYCYCPSCRRKFREHFGVDLSPEAPAELLDRFKMRTVVDYLTEVRAIVDRRHPDLAVFMNSAGCWRVSREVDDLCDAGCWESQPRPGDYLTHSFAARTARNDRLPVQVMTVRFYQGWGDMTMKPAPQLITEFAAMIGNGAPAVSGDQVCVDGTLQAPVYDLFNRAFGFVEERESVLKGAESVRHVAVLLPAPDPRLPMNHAVVQYEAEATPWRGCHKMLVESHIQTDQVYSLLADDLSRFPVIVLPEPAAYQEGMYDRLRDYVHDGGTLVAVGGSLLRGGEFHLQDVFGIQYLEPLSFSLAHFVPAPEVRGGTPDIPLQARGRVHKVRCAGAVELAALYYPQSDWQPPVRAFRSPYSPAADERSPFSFAAVNDYGKGRAVYVAASIFEIYWRTNHHWLRRFMEAVLRHVDPTMPCDVEASGLVEANLMRKGDDLLLNLVHYALGHQGGATAIAAIERVEPIHDIACSVRCESVNDVILEPEGRRIPFACKNGVCRLTVPEIEYMAIVRLVGAAAGKADLQGDRGRARKTP